MTNQNDAALAIRLAVGIANNIGGREAEILIKMKGGVYESLAL